MNAETLLGVRIASFQGIWLDSHAQDGEDNVPTVKSEDIGNTESEAKNNAQHTGPNVKCVRVVFAMKSSNPEALGSALKGSRLPSVRPPQPSFTVVFEIAGAQRGDAIESTNH